MVKEDFINRASVSGGKMEKNSKTLVDLMNSGGKKHSTNKCKR